MIQVKRRRASDALEINMGPLIDLVFLLLIFFLVTTTFVKETGLEVHRPSAKTAERKEKSTILIGISKEGTIYMENRIIDIRSVRANVEKLLAENPELVGGRIAGAQLRSMAALMKRNPLFYGIYLGHEDGSFHDDSTGVFHQGFDRQALKRVVSDAGFTRVDIATASVVREARGDYPVFLLTAFS